MSGLFDGTPLERPVTCAVCSQTLDLCSCPRNDKGDVLLPKDQLVSIRSEKRKKGKVVTVVAGLDRSASDLNAILKELKNICAAGGTITNDQIEIQGNHSDKVTKALADRGYPIRQ